MLPEITMLRILPTASVFILRYFSGSGYPKYTLMTFRHCDIGLRYFN